jgi:hypothetical protein
MFTEYTIELWALATTDYIFFDRNTSHLQPATEMFVFHLMQEEG